MSDVILTSLNVLKVAIYAAVAWLLITKYWRTRQIGFLLLGAGLLFLPVPGAVVGVVGQARWALTDGVTVGYTIVLINSGLRVIQASLILLGIVYIARSQSTLTLTPTRHT